MTTGHPTEEEATATLEQAGFKVQTRDARRTRRSVGRVIDQSPGPGHAPLDRGDGHDLRRRRRRRGRRRPRRRPRRHEGRGPRRRALVRARRLAELRRRRARGRRGRRPRGAAGDDRALRRLGARGRRRCRCARAAACSAPTSSSRSCTARSARTGRSRGCWSCSTCPTSARACSPPRCAWTRSSSRRSWPPPDVPQVPYAGVRLARWRAEPEAVRRELAVLGTPVFVKPARLGSSVGIAKVWSEAELGRARSTPPSPTTAS